MSKKKILILGAGLAGLSAAWHLQRRRIDYRIFEKEASPGGLCRSKKINGWTFDCDGHLLHFKHQWTFSFVRALLKDNLAEHRRDAAVYLGGRYVHYPFQANFYGLTPAVVKECLLGSIEARARGHHKKRNPNFLEWINQTFGRGVAKHFMIPYNTKFWTVAPQELTCAWLDGFIPVPSLSQVIEGAVEESRRPFGYNARFWYPKKGGIEGLVSGLARPLKNLHTGCPVTGINLSKKEVIIGSGTAEKFDTLILTLPLPELPALVSDMPASLVLEFKKLRWTSIFNLNLGLERKAVSSKHWIYFPQPGFSFFRVGFPHNFSGTLTPPQKSSLYIETAYSQDKPLDKTAATVSLRRDLEKAKIIFPEDKIPASDVNDIKYGYPLYDKNYVPARRKIINFLLKHNIVPCGRYGAWRYMTMEDALLDGKEAVSAMLQ